MGVNQYGPDGRLLVQIGHRIFDPAKIILIRLGASTATLQLEGAPAPFDLNADEWSALRAFLDGETKILKLGGGGHGA